MEGHQIADIRVLSLPLRTRFRGLTSRELIVFRGAKRYAEFSPFVEYEDQEASQWLRAAMEFANEDLPELKREWVGVNATLPAVNGSEIDSVLETFPGFRTVKIKIAEHPESLSEDLARVRQVAKTHADAKIRLDANGGLSVSQSLQLIEELAEIRLEYFEQPVRTIAELKELREQIANKNLGTKIAADESIRKAEDPLLVAREKAADIAIIKVQPLGGIQSASNIAKQSGLDVVVSSALESSLGLAQGLYLAASFDELPYDNGLWTQNLLADDIVKEPLRVEDARIKVTVPELDEKKLDQYRAPKEREEFWLQRIQRCLRLLES